VNHSRVFRSINAATVIWLATFAVAQAQITPFTTQPQPLNQTQPQPLNQTQPQSQPGVPGAPVSAPATPVAQAPIDVRPNYELGPSDQILIHAPNAEELNDKAFRIEDDGTATLPLLGVVKMGGSTLQQVEEDLKNRLKTYVRDPVVTITVVQFRSAPVFFVGQFMRPGIYPLAGRHTLVEMMQTVGGLQPTAGRRIKVTRKTESGPIPLSSAVADPGAKTTSVEISLVSLTQNINPAEDIELQPYDVISVERAEQVYLLGAFGRSGGIDIGDRDYISALQLISQAGGLGESAIPEQAVILRPVLDTARRAMIPVNLAKVLTTEGNDYPLLPNDILYVPAKKKSKFMESQWFTRILTIAVSIGTSLLLYETVYK
jgi:polysaccharide biosynthesis/export protein